MSFSPFSRSSRASSSSHLDKVDHVKKLIRRKEKPEHHPSQCMVHKLLNIDDWKPKEDEDDEISAPELVSDTTTDTEEEPQFLSKDSLSEMVVSVRDLSKSLSNLSMKITLSNILIVSKIHDRSLFSVTRELAEYLLSIEGSQFNVYVQDIMADSPDFGYQKLKGKKSFSSRLRFWTPELCRKHPNTFDLVMTLGGDGTVLYTSWLFQKVVPPVLCFSLGSLGFMTEYDYDKRFEVIPHIIKNGLKCSLRMRFECAIMRAKSTKGKDDRSLQREIEDAENSQGFLHHSQHGEMFCILNDVVVDRGPNPTITTTELYGDCKYLTAIQADGVVISTPSGSTAYSLSAGGSLVHPDIPGILISPICPHTLSFRPLVLPDTLVIRVGVPYDARSSAWCSFDGKSRIELKQGDFLTVTASRFPFPMVQDGNGGTNWFERLSKTLNWNERKRQVAFT